MASGSIQNTRVKKKDGPRREGKIRERTGISHNIRFISIRTKTLSMVQHSRRTSNVSENDDSDRFIGYNGAATG